VTEQDNTPIKPEWLHKRRKTPAKTDIEAVLREHAEKAMNGEYKACCLCFLREDGSGRYITSYMGPNDWIALLGLLDYAKTKIVTGED
jgi:hypothetical protein